VVSAHAPLRIERHALGDTCRTVNDLAMQDLEVLSRSNEGNMSEEIRVKTDLAVSNTKKWVSVQFCPQVSSRNAQVQLVGQA
jgi:hypothetical protein